MSDIQSIVIVGGGPTGWLAACWLQRTLAAARQSPLPITLIEPPPQRDTLDVFGPELATLPTLRHTLQALGLPERELFTAADATLSNGLRFTGWREGGPARQDRYDQPFDMPQPFHGFAATAHWLNLLQRGLMRQPMAQACAVQPTLFDGHLSPKLMDSPDYQAPVSYGYQLDAARLAMLLQQVARQRGVHHVHGRVVNVERGPQGIAAVELDDGRRCEASFFIDCSGAQSVLLQQALQVPWVSFADWLPCDREVSLSLAHPQRHGALRSCTTVAAQPAGWTWDLDLQGRRGIGHVYASSHGSDEDALQALRRLGAGEQELGAARLRTLRNGHAARVWEQNCLALGAAAGALEPLQPMQLYMVEWLLQLVVDHIAPAGDGAACRGRVNRLFGEFCEELRDFTVAHYALSQRRDTPFWRERTAAGALPPRLAELLALWDSKVPTPTDLDRRLSLVGVAQWSYLLAGLHRLPARGTGLAGHISPEISQQAMAQVEHIRRQAAEQSPTMRDYLLSLEGVVISTAAH